MAATSKISLADIWATSSDIVVSRLTSLGQGVSTNLNYNRAVLAILYYNDNKIVDRDRHIIEHPDFFATLSTSSTLEDGILALTKPSLKSVKEIWELDDATMEVILNSNMGYDHDRVDVHYHIRRDNPNYKRIHGLINAFKYYSVNKLIDEQDPLYTSNYYNYINLVSKYSRNSYEEIAPKLLSLIVGAKVNSLIVFIISLRTKANTLFGHMKEELRDPSEHKILLESEDASLNLITHEFMYQCLSDIKERDMPGKDFIHMLMADKELLEYVEVITEDLTHFNYIRKVLDEVPNKVTLIPLIPKIVTRDYLENENRVHNIIKSRMVHGMEQYSKLIGCLLDANYDTLLFDIKAYILLIIYEIIVLLPVEEYPKFIGKWRDIVTRYHLEDIFYRPTVLESAVPSNIPRELITIMESYRDILPRDEIINRIIVSQQL